MKPGTAPVVGYDADGIIHDLVQRCLDIWNMERGTYFTIEQVTDWDIDKALGLTPEEARDFFALFDRPGLYEDLPAYDGAIDSMKELHDVGHDVLIITAAPGPESAKGKLIAFQRQLPWLSRKKVWIGYEKYRLYTDFLIDDGAHNIMAQRRHQPNTTCLGLEQPWNRAQRGLWHVLFPDYRRAREAYRELTDHIRTATRL